LSEKLVGNGDVGKSVVIELDCFSLVKKETGGLVLIFTLSL